MIYEMMICMENLGKKLNVSQYCQYFDLNFVYFLACCVHWWGKLHVVMAYPHV